jgi:hypothetical protein
MVRMKKNFVIYCVLGMIAIACAVTSIYAVQASVKTTAAVTLFVALAGLVVQLIRDEGAHQRAIELADRANDRTIAATERAHDRTIAASERAHERSLVAADHEKRFTLGISSRMANVAFDKHVEFCEAYALVAFKALGDIFRDGATVDAVDHGRSLFAVRRAHAVWITQEIDEKLQKFEDLFMEMGASAGYVQDIQGSGEASQRQEHIDRMYKHLMTLTGGREWKAEELDGEKAVMATIRWLRGVLGTEELNAVRRAFVKRAMTELGS